MLEYNEFYLTLVRHGQSTTNQNPDLLGQEWNTPLSDNGRHQAELLNKRLVKEKVNIDYVWSSTYTRAIDTANISLMNVPHATLNKTSELREYDAGDWTGMSRIETLTLPIKTKMGALGHGFLPPNGESLHKVERRASLWLEDNIIYNGDVCANAKALRNCGERPLNIFLFSHGMTIKTILHYIMGFDQNFTWRIDIKNTSLTKLYFGQDGWKLLSINDCAHLTLL